MANGYSQEAIKQVKDFLELLKEYPEEFPMFYEITLTPNQLIDSFTSKPIRTVEAIVQKTAEIYVFGKHFVNLGVGTVVDEQKVIGRFPKYQLKCRRCYGDCWAWFSHPELESVISDVEECAKASVTSAVLAAIWIDPDAALPAFKASFVACMELKSISWANQIDIGFDKRDRCGDWHACG